MIESGKKKDELSGRIRFCIIIPSVRSTNQILLNRRVFNGEIHKMVLFTCFVKFHDKTPVTMTNGTIWASAKH